MFRYGKKNRVSDYRKEVININEVVYVIDCSRLIWDKEYQKKIKEFKSKEDNNCCRECGKIVDKYDKKADHNIPVTIGGKFFGDNLQILCNLCHKHKTRFDNKFIKFLQSIYILKAFGGFNETNINPEILTNYYLELRRLTKDVYNISNAKNRIDFNNKNE